MNVSNILPGLTDLIMNHSTLMTSLSTLLGGGIVLKVALALENKFLPGLISQGFLGLNRWLVNPSNANPAEKQCLKDMTLALVKLAETSIPDAKAGSLKYQLVASRLVALVPMLKGQDATVEQLIEEAVTILQAQLQTETSKLSQ